MKKITGMSLAVFSMALLVYLTEFLGSPVRLSEVAVDEGQLEEILEGRHVSDTALVDELYFDGQKLMYDRAAETFFYSVAEGAGDAYDPHIEKKTSRGGEVSLAVLDAGITEQSIRTSKKLRMVAYSEDVYSEYGIICTTLPLMHLECGGDIGDEKIPVHISVFDNGRGAPVQKGDMGSGGQDFVGSASRS